MLPQALRVKENAERLEGYGSEPPRPCKCRSLTGVIAAPLSASSLDQRSEHDQRILVGRVILANRSRNGAEHVKSEPFPQVTRNLIL